MKIQNAYVWRSRAALLILGWKVSFPLLPPTHKLSKQYFQQAGQEETIAKQMK